MDTDAAFAADAGLSKTSARVQIRTGEEDVLAATGGFDPEYTNAESEHSPLLGPDKNDPRRSSDSTINDFDGMPWYRTPSIWWVLLPFGAIAVAYGGIMTPRVNLVINLVCREYMQEQEQLDSGFLMTPVVLDGGANPQCGIPEVSSRSSMFLLYCNLIAGLCSAFVSPRLGALSDRHGRVKMIALTSAGHLVLDMLTILAAEYPDRVSYNWLLAGFALDGLCGSFTTAMALIHAYATDCVPVDQRNVAFGYFHGFLFTGMSVGPILAGLLTKATGTLITSFYVMLVVHAVFMLFVGLVVPESLSTRRQQQAREKHRLLKLARSTDWIETLRAINLLEPLKILWPTAHGSNPAIRRNLVVLAAVDTMVFGVAMGSMTVVIIYTRQIFGWETYESAVFMSIVNSTRVVVLFLVLPLLTRFFRDKATSRTKSKTGADLFDVVIIRVAVFFDTLGYLGYTLARSGPMMILSGAVASLGGMGSPTLQSALTKHVPSDNVGQMLGAVGLLHALARVVAPTLFNGIFSATAGTFAQAVFVVLVAAFGLAFVGTWFVKPGVTLDHHDRSEDEEAEGEAESSHLMATERDVE